MARSRTSRLAVLSAVPAPANGAAPESRPRVIFVVGVNGTGKTTTIGKLAHRLSQDGSSALCAGDLSRRRQRAASPCGPSAPSSELIQQKSGADPAAVVYDALTAALARGVDAVIVDTAGRLHTKSNLMAEHEKMKRTAAKLVPGRAARLLHPPGARRHHTGQNGLCPSP